MARLPDSELANYENAIALSLSIIQSVKRAVYLTNDPDMLAELIRIAEDSARIRQLTIAEMGRRRGKKNDRPGVAGLEDRVERGEKSEEFPL